MAKEKTDLGKRLEAIRMAIDISKEEFSTKLGYSHYNSYSGLMTGVSGISIAAITELNKNFPWVNLHWLLIGEGEMRTDSEKINVVAEPQAEYKTALQLEQEKNKNLERLLAAKDEIISLLKNKS